MNLNRARQANADPETLKYYASGLSGFAIGAIDGACAELEGEVPDQFARWPSLGRLQQVCRQHSESYRRETRRKQRSECLTCRGEGMLIIPANGEPYDPSNPATADHARPCPDCMKEVWRA